MPSQPGQRLILFATIAAYCLIGVEIIIMISPFALYFYSVYGPILDFFSSYPALNWSTEFFLPHMVFLDDPLILGISYLQVLMVVGLLLFLAAAIPLYYGRFTGKGVVQASFYGKTRHPQYLFLAISGFGLLLYWPRFIILFMYITMLFVYYLLARNEEWRMRQEATVSYKQYMQTTPMFLPGEPGGKIYAAFFGRIRPKWFGILILYLATILLSLGVTMGIRGYTVRQLPLLTRPTLTLLPVYPRPKAEVAAVYDKLVANPAVQAEIAANDANLAYIFPGDYFLTAIVTDKERQFSDDIIQRFPEVLEWHQNKFRGGLGKFFRIFFNFISSQGNTATNYDVERVVLVRVIDTQGHRASPRQLFGIGTKRTPLMIVDLDATDHRILAISQSSGKHKWGNMPMPTF